MHTKYTKAQLKQAIEDKLNHHFGINAENATEDHFFRACALIMRDELVGRLTESREQIKACKKKQVHYLSMEFLVGRSLYNNAYNIGMLEPLTAALKDYGVCLADLLEHEPDPGLGNGGLGRLAACYMDALATLDIPACGYSIRYKHGVFKQKIIDGAQVELPDSWLEEGENFMIARLHRTQEVRFGGTVEEYWEDGRLKIRHTGYTPVLAVPYEMPISGYASNEVCSLKLWDAKSPVEVDMNLFSRGQYLKAVEQNALAGVISMVLYPEDNHPEGQSLRLKQQYFFVSATVQYLTQKHREQYGTLENFAEKNIIHINDTHPALAIPELMRILLDEEGMSWEQAWDIVTHTVAYTNHTVLSEALERWPVGLFELLLPRITMIIKEINERYCRSLWKCFEGDFDKISSMAVVAYDEIRMANLAIAGSFSVNGVSELHSDILKNDVFHSFYLAEPKKFTNVTNGIAHRRWLCQANPELSELIRELIGDKFITDASRLSDLKKFKDDAAVLDKLAKIKLHNKQRLAEYTLRKSGISVDPESMFDVQAKRLHEYKRQLLNLMEIIAEYHKIKDDPNGDYLPRTFFFAAKASPGYAMAKEIIRLIHGVAKMIARDPVASKFIKVVFLEDYKVSLAEILIPAAELSEQISTAGKEASGTGNMKFMMNGALTIGTLDGANVEMSREAGIDNLFIFGLRADEAQELLSSGKYNPALIYQQNADVRRVLDTISKGVGDGVNYQNIVTDLTLCGDRYLLMADFNSYEHTRDRACELYRDAGAWNKKALINIASSGYFAADRAVAEYAENIWHINCGEFADTKSADSNGKSGKKEHSGSGHKTAHRVSAAK